MQVVGDYLYTADPDLGSTLRSNAATYLYWEEGPEDVYTNDRGWRVAEKGAIARPADILAAGCSWTMGVGVSYEDSIVGQLESGLDRPVVNLGVGSYSLLQSVRRIEKEIGFVRPKFILLMYGDWLIDRCFKDNAFAGFIFRPVLKRLINDGSLTETRPRALPDDLLDLAADIERNRTSRELTRYEEAQRRVVERWLQIRNGYGLSFVKSRLGFRTVERLSPRKREHREAALNYCLQHLDALCAGHGARAILCHLADPRLVLSEEDGAEARQEDRLVDNAVSGCSNVSHLPRRHVLGNLEQFIAREGINAENWQEHLLAREHNHPNKQGYQLVAEGILSGLSQEFSDHAVLQPAIALAAD